jgi:hypothetical protein
VGESAGQRLYKARFAKLPLECRKHALVPRRLKKPNKTRLRKNVSNTLLREGDRTTRTIALKSRQFNIECANLNSERSFSHGVEHTSPGFFIRTLNTLLQEYRVIVEISPHPTLSMTYENVRYTLSTI